MAEIRFSINRVFAYFAAAFSLLMAWVGASVTLDAWRGGETEFLTLAVFAASTAVVFAVAVGYLWLAVNRQPQVETCGDVLVIRHFLRLSLVPREGILGLRRRHFGAIEVAVSEAHKQKPFYLGRAINPRINTFGLDSYKPAEAFQVLERWVADRSA